MDIPGRWSKHLRESARPENATRTSARAASRQTPDTRCPLPRCYQLIPWSQDVQIDDAVPGFSNFEKHLEDSHPELADEETKQAKTAWIKSQKEAAALGGDRFGFIPFCSSPPLTRPAVFSLPETAARSTLFPAPPPVKGKARRPSQRPPPPARVPVPPPTDDDSTSIIKQPETRPISQEQLVAEVKGIYAGLVMVESKCIEVDNNQSSQTDPANKLNNDQWQALIALHRTLLHEHHDFFLASQHPRPARRCEDWLLSTPCLRACGGTAFTVFSSFCGTVFQ